MSPTFASTARPALLDALGRAPFDLLVIGGGITGAGVARDAALRGLSVALVERDDFASGTSSRSSRLVHGGVRYLEHGEFHLVFESSRERRILLHIAPHLVRPLPFVWPVYERARIPAWKLQAGLFLYDVLSLFRNVGRARRLTPTALAALEPRVRRDGLVGGARYYDAATDDARLTIANAQGAAAAGAVVLNHVEARSLVVEGNAVRGAEVCDIPSGRVITVRAAVVINAAGPWSDTIRRLAVPTTDDAVRGTKGVHVAVPRGRVGNHEALTLLSPIDGRVMFVLPAGEPFTIIGTTDTDYRGALDRVRATSDDVDYLLQSANAFFPDARLVASDVISAWAGVRPLVSGNGGDPGSVSREHAITWSTRGLLSVTGGKLTTYRSMAAEVVDVVCRALDQPARAITHRTPLPGGNVGSLAAEIDAAAAGFPRDVATHLVHAYGTSWRAIAERVRREPALGARLAAALPYIAAELPHGVEEEMALTLGDLLIRRMHLAFELSDHGVSLAYAAARCVAPLFGWSDAMIDERVRDYAMEVERMFRITGRDEAGD